MNFLDLGTQLPEPARRGMLNLALTEIEISPTATIFTGFVTMIVVMGFNFLGNGLRDILDPRLLESSVATLAATDGTGTVRPYD